MKNTINCLDEKKFNRLTDELLIIRLHIYLYAEHIRAKASHLLDDNKFHNINFDRFLKNKDQFCQLVGIDNFENIPLEIEHHLQHHLNDSYLIAYRILSVAITLKKNPEYEIQDSDDWGHGLKILRDSFKNPLSRVNKKDIQAEINALFKTCDSHVPLTAHHQALNKEALLKSAEEQLSALYVLKSNQQSPLKKYGLFALAATGLTCAAVAVYANNEYKLF